MASEHVREDFIDFVEAIAFYRGERREADVAGTRLRSLVAIARLKVCVHCVPSKVLPAQL